MIMKLHALLTNLLIVNLQVNSTRTQMIIQKKNAIKKTMNILIVRQVTIHLTIIMINQVNKHHNATIFLIKTQKIRRIVKTTILTISQKINLQKINIIILLITLQIKIILMTMI